MYELLGAREINAGKVTFSLFFPDRGVDSAQYEGGGLPNVSQVRAIGDFQAELGGANWDPGSGPLLVQSTGSDDNGKAIGWKLSVETPMLPDGFYEYRYHLTFADGTTRTIADPCSRYGGKAAGNSGFVIGGRQVAAIATVNRAPYADWIVYELNLDDFTAQYRGTRAPIEAVTDKLAQLKALGFNAVELMPWTAWPTAGFSWGYNPYLYFSVSHEYTNDAAQPADKLVLLSDLINACHAQGLYVIMDGVFNHVEADPPESGFGYYWLYRTLADSPYVGDFAAHDFFRDLDYQNDCVRAFIFDVCRYWIDHFAIDGIRLDNTLGFYKPDDRGHGLPRLLADLRAHLASTANSNFALILEHSWDYSAIDVTNKVAATSSWYDMFRSQSMDFIGNRRVLPSMMRMLCSGTDFEPDRVPTIYLENHDHKAFMLKASGDRNEWWRMQPYLIALFTCTGAVLVHNGQEFGFSYDMPESGDGRVVPRPLDWTQFSDVVGTSVRRLITLLSNLRTAHPALRSSNFYPSQWNQEIVTRDANGFGIDVDAQVVVYHRFGTNAAGKLERFYVVLNFSDDPNGRTVQLQVAALGTWTDLLSADSFITTDYGLSVWVGRCWGRVLYQST
jgi:pullulanase